MISNSYENKWIATKSTKDFEFIDVREKHEGGSKKNK